MTQKAFLFPGQGSQYVGMQSPYVRFSWYRQIMDSAADVLGYDLEKVISGGPEDELKKTEITQPALFVISALGLQFLKEKGESCTLAAGHSLGEFSALLAAGVLEFDEALSLVKLRGSLMAEAGSRAPGVMSAILGLAPADLEETLAGFAGRGTVVVANYNSPSQLVISGEASLMDSVEAALSEKGAKKVVRLPVSGAFHSPLMEFAVAGLTQAINDLDFQNPSVPIIQNVTGKMHTSGEEIRNNLIKQITSPVRWIDTVEWLVNEGVSEALEVGPGKVLMGLCRGISRDVKVTPVESLAESA